MKLTFPACVYGEVYVGAGRPILTVDGFIPDLNGGGRGADE